jgi:GxxExxY protein
MKTARTPLLHAELTEVVIATFLQVHHELGYGFLESVYSAAMGCMFLDLGLPFERELPLEVMFRGVRVATFRADFIADSRLLIEIKAGTTWDPTAEAQALNYLRATNLELALVLHFGPKPRFKRLIYTNDRKQT